MNDLLQRLNDLDRRRTPPAAGPLVRPRDAATLLILERGPEPRVLVGRRHHGHVFMPNKFVFPGGRVDPADARVRALTAYDDDVAARLANRVPARHGAARLRALGIAAIRETYEEAGILIGAPAVQSRSSRRRPFDVAPIQDLPAGDVPAGVTAAQPTDVAASATPHRAMPHAETWAAFAAHGLAPSLAPLRFIARAVTPTGSPRRFDARFFAVWSDAIAARLDGAGPSGELEELQWIPLDEAADLELPSVTRIVIAELRRRLAVDPSLTAPLPVPYYRWNRASFVRDEL